MLEIHHVTNEFQKILDRNKSKTMMISVSIFEFKPK
jgi:hypothetical protein